jgi:hypothetical protein
MVKTKTAASTMAHVMTASQIFRHIAIATHYNKALQQTVQCREY